MWLGGDAQVQQEMPCVSRLKQEEIAEWQGLVDVIQVSLTRGKADPL